MSKIRYAALFVAVLCLTASSAFAQEDAETVDGKIQVKLTEQAKSQVAGQEGALPETISQARTGIQSLDQLAQRFGVERMERVFRPAGKHEARHVKWGLDRWYVVHYEGDAAPENVARSYLSSASVEAGSPVYEKAKTVLDETPSWVNDDEPEQEEQATVRRSQPDEGQSFIPNDPGYGSQWHYNNTSDNPGTPGADINLPGAHDIETGQPSVVISIVDGGLDLDHPEFEGMLWINEEEDINNNGQFDPTPASEGGDLNGVDDDNNGFVDDVIGYDHGADDAIPSADGDHGTHVAGTVAAKNNNGQFVAGVAGGDGSPDSGVRLMINQTFSSGGTAGFAEAVTYAADNGAVVSQNSWGYTSEGAFEQPVLDAIDYFRANAGGPNAPMDGGVYVNSSGNSDSDGEWYPGFYEGSYAVSATGPNDSKAGYSNYGDWMDVAAPGGDGLPYDEADVQSTVVGGVGPLGGTSMAAPHVSGVIGLVASVNPGMTNEAMEQHLKDTGVDISDNQPERMGPRIDAEAAVATVSGDNTPPAAISDLAASSGTSSEPGAGVELTWTAPGNDGMTGFADSYDIRYSTDGPIDDSTAFANAEQVSGEPVPDTAGTTQSYTVEGLSFETEVHFAIRATDIAGNSSDVSNSPSFTTPVGPVASFQQGGIETDITVGQTETLTATLENTGSVALQFNINEEELPGYLSVSPSQDSIAVEESAEIDFVFDATGLDLETFEYTVDALVSKDGASSVASLQTTLDVNTAPYPFAVDTESIEATLANSPDAPAETVTQTVTITNESDRSQQFEIFGGAATSASMNAPTPQFTGEDLRDWMERREKRLNGEYDFEDSAEQTAKAYDGPRAGRSSLVSQNDAVIPSTRLTGSATSVFGPESGNFVDLPIDNPEGMSAVSASPTAFAGNYAYGEDDNYYVITDADNAFHEIDRETGEITTLGTVEPETSAESWTEIAVDPTNGKIYGSTSGGAGTNKLYEITPPQAETGSPQVELVTELNTSGLIIATAIDGTGQMYGLDISSDELVEIDTDEGDVTSVGSVGFNANFAQGMDFDLKTGNLYMAAYETAFFGLITSGITLQADPETGETTFLGYQGGGEGAELGYLALPSVGFVEPSLTQGTLPAGSSTEVQMTLTAERLNDGEYNSEVHVASNVAGQPRDTIDVTMNVNGEPQLAVVPEGDSTIAFDSTFVQDTTAAELVTVRNEGTADMEAMFSASEQFTASQDSVSLFPGEATTLEVTFTPTSTGSFEGALTVESGDSTDTVDLTGVGAPRPIAELSQSEFEVQMYPGQSYTRTLSMTNAGGSALEFIGMESNVELPGQSAVAPIDGVPKEDFEGGVPPEDWQAQDVPGQGVTWQTNEAYDRENFTGSGLAAHVDSDENQDVPYDARLVSPVKTFDGETALSFDLNYQEFSGNENFDLDVSTDGGGTWTTVRSFEETGGFLGDGENITITNETLSEYMETGQTFQVRFRYWTPEEQPWDWYAQVDNVAFQPTTTQFFTFDPTEGTIQPDSTEDLTLSFNADNIASGTYEVDMVFDTNDPVGQDGDGTVTVPVTIDVIESLSVSAEPETGDKDVVYPNEEFMVPVMVESLDDLAVESYQFTMNFDGDLVEPMGVVKDSSLSEGLTLSSSLNENSVSVAAIEGIQDGQSQSASPVLFDIEGEGALVFVNFRAEETLGTSELSFPEVQFNEGNPPASGDTTSAEVAPLYGDVNQDLSIMSSDAMLVLDSWVEDATLSDSQFQAADVTGDGSVSALDASKIMEFTVGGIDCFPAAPDCGAQAALAAQETGGGSETATASFAWGETTQNSKASSEGKQLALPLVLRSTDTAVRSIQVSTTIDREKVSVESVESQLPDGWQMTHNVAKDGTLKMALAGPTPVTQPGDVATVTLRQKESGAKMEMGGTIAVNETESQELETKSVVSIPDEFALEGTYPNPFSQTATLEMQLPEKAGVTVEVYDVLGRQVKTAYDGELQAGASRTIQINGSNLSTGTYFYRVTVEMGEDSRTESGRMTVVR